MSNSNQHAETKAVAEPFLKEHPEFGPQVMLSEIIEAAIKTGDAQAAELYYAQLINLAPNSAYLPSLRILMEESKTEN